MTNGTEKRISLKGENVTLGEEKNKAIGSLKPSSRADVQWGFRGDLLSGKNYFTALFIVNSDLKKTVLNINDQNFKIKKIKDSAFPTFCVPSVKIISNEFLSELSYDTEYRKFDKQPLKKVFKPRSGKILNLSISIEFCDKVVLNERKPFMYLPSYFQLVDESGASFDCLGVFKYGKLGKAITPFNLGGSSEYKSDVTLVFNVPKEGSYKIKYLGKEVGEF